MRLSLLFTVAFGIVFTASVDAQNTGTLPRVLQLPASTHAMALGNAYMMNAGHADAIFYHPALLVGASGFGPQKPLKPANAQDRKPTNVRLAPETGYFLQNPIRCHPNRRTSHRGMALNVPTKRPLKAAAFQPLCKRDFTGNRSGTIRASEKPPSKHRNSAIEYFFSTGASACSSPTPTTFDKAFSQDTRL